MPVVKTDDGVSLSYSVRGTGPRNLVFMHGWAGSGAYFDEMIEKMDLKGLRVVTFDLRGHGASQQVSQGFDHERFAKDLLAVATAADAHKFVIVGFSMAGRFAQYVTATAP